MHRNDAKFAALRAQNFTGALPDMTLQWLQANGAPAPVNLYVNPELAGGSASGPVDGSNPPTAHSIGFITTTGIPQDDGDGVFTWRFNEAGDNARCFLQYDLLANNPGLNVGTLYRVQYTVFGLNVNYVAALATANVTNIDIVSDQRGSTVGQQTQVFIDFIPQAGWSGTLRVGAGTTANNIAGLDVSDPQLYEVVDNGARSIDDAWRAFLDAQLGAEATGHRNDDWYKLLGNLGYSGALPDRERDFWLNGGVIAPIGEYTLTVGWNGGFIYGYRDEPGDQFGAMIPNVVNGVPVTRLQVNPGNTIGILLFNNTQLPGVDTVLWSANGETATLDWTPGSTDYRTDAMPTGMRDYIVANLDNTIPMTLVPVAQQQQGTLDITTPVGDFSTPAVLTAQGPFVAGPVANIHIRVTDGGAQDFNFDVTAAGVLTSEQMAQQIAAQINGSITFAAQAIGAQIRITPEAPTHTIEILGV